MRIVLADPPSYTRPYDHSLAAALARRGHEVDLIASPFLYGETPAADGYRLDELFLPLSGRVLRRSPRSRLRVLVKAVDYAPSVVRLLRRIDALDPDVVHLQWLAQPRFDVRWVRRLARRGPLVFTAHDLGAPRRPPAPVWRELLALVRRVIVHSERAVEGIERLGVPRERIVEIPHAVFDAPARKEASAPAGRTVLFFGLLREYKGLDVLLRALPAVARAVPDARLVVAGDPVDPVEPLRLLAAELGVAERVEWRLGFRPEREVAELMADAALVALPYRTLDSSGVLATALGHARPVVVSDVGSLGTLVREYGAGRVVAPGDSGELATAISELLGDAAALRAAHEGAARAARELTWDAAAEAHERVYRAAIG